MTAFSFNGEYPEQKRLFHAVLEMLRIRKDLNPDSFFVPFFLAFLFFPQRAQ